MEAKIPPLIKYIILLLFFFYSRNLLLVNIIFNTLIIYRFISYRLVYRLIHLKRDPFPGSSTRILNMFVEIFLRNL